MKRKSIFKYLHDKNLDVILLQETHVTKENLLLYQQKWGSNWFSTSGTSNSKGTSILVKNKYCKCVNDITVDKDGRYVICTLDMEDTKITLCNVYAPNYDEPAFFASLLECVNKYNNEHVIIGGDFNLVLNPELDRYKSTHNHYQSTKLLLNFTEENNFFDVW